MSESNVTHTEACQFVWQTLSKIDCSKHVEKKMGLSYLSWAWAYGMMMDNFPSFRYNLDEVKYYDNRTAEVGCSVSVEYQGQEVAKHMWLPVMDHKNKAIVSPDSVAINKAKMRVLCKAISMLGLGAYIYAGEDIPAEQTPDPVLTGLADDLRGDDMAGGAYQPQKAQNPVAAPLGGGFPAPGDPKLTAIDVQGNVTTLPGPPPGAVPVQYKTAQVAGTPPTVPDRITIETEEAAAESVQILVKLAQTMHSDSMASLRGFWEANKQTVTEINKYPDQYRILQDSFNAIRANVKATETSS